tara:strand:+ start:763 stop:2610 length:1848 start_codon:yes stop_codon:yes gene_type:complete
MSFITGFVGGLATSVNKRLEDDLERTYDKVSKLSALRAKTIAEGSSKHASQFKSYETGLNSLSSIVGNDMDLVDYLINQSGGSIEAATAKATEIQNAVANTSGKFNAYDLLGLEQRQGNIAKITAKQIAQKIKGAYVPPPKVTGETAVGLNQLFNYDISPSINRETDQLLSASGIVFNKKENDVSYASTLTSSGERTKFINAYNENDSRKRAIKFGHIAENTAFLMGATDDPKKIEELTLQYNVAKGEIEVHKSIIRDLDNKDSDPKPFTLNETNSLKKQVAGELNIYSGAKLASPLSGAGGFEGKEWVSNYEKSEQGSFLLAETNRVVSHLAYIKTEVTKDGKTFSDKSPNVILDTQNEILSFIRRGIDYKIKYDVDANGYPTVTVLGKHINEYDSILNELNTSGIYIEDPEDIGDQVTSSTTLDSAFKSFFPSDLFELAPKYEELKREDIMSADKNTSSTDKNTTVQKEMSELNNIYSAWRSEYPQAPGSNFLNFYKDKYKTKLTDQNIMSATFPANENNNDSTTWFSGLFAKSEEEKFESKLKENKGVSYALSGQKFNGIEVNKIVVTNSGTILLNVTYDDGQTSSISMLHPNYNTIVNAGFSLQAAIESNE